MLLSSVIAHETERGKEELASIARLNPNSNALLQSNTNSPSPKPCTAVGFTHSQCSTMSGTLTKRVIIIMHANHTPSGKQKKKQKQKKHPYWQINLKYKNRTKLKIKKIFLHIATKGSHNYERPTVNQRNLKHTQSYTPSFRQA